MIDVLQLWIDGRNEYFDKNEVNEEEIEWYPDELPYYKLWKCLPHKDKTSDSFPHDEYFLYLLINAAFKGMKNWFRRPSFKDSFVLCHAMDAVGFLQWVLRRT